MVEYKKLKLIEEQQIQSASVEFLKTSRHYFSGFESILSQVCDPRKSNYTGYPIEEILYPIIPKNVFNLQSMREAGDTFISHTSVENLRAILNTEAFRQ